MSHNPILFLRQMNNGVFSLIAEKGHVIYSFRANSRQQAMWHAENYVSSWPGVIVEWFKEEKDGK